MGSAQRCAVTGPRLSGRGRSAPPRPSRSYFRRRCGLGRGAASRGSPQAAGPFVTGVRVSVCVSAPAGRARPQPARGGASPARPACGDPAGAGAAPARCAGSGCPQVSAGAAGGHGTRPGAGRAPAAPLAPSPRRTGGPAGRARSPPRGASPGTGTPCQGRWLPAPAGCGRGRAEPGQREGLLVSPGNSAGPGACPGAGPREASGPAAAQPCGRSWAAPGPRRPPLPGGVGSR